MIKITLLTVCMALSALLMTPATSMASPFNPTYKQIAKQIADSGIGRHELDITVRQGECEITGTVSSEADRDRVLEIARATSGVTSVESDIAVNPDWTNANAALANRVDQALANAKDVTGYNIAIKASGTTITLNGSATKNADKSRIIEIVHSVSGVTDVVDEISVPVLTDAELERNLRAALAANPDLTLDDTQISVRDGVAYFSGPQRNHRDLDALLSNALMVPGIKGVESSLTTKK